MITELNHVGIVVRDLEASLAFYGGRFEARTVFRSFIDASRTDVVYLRIGSGLVELLHPVAPGPDERFGITHLGFLSDDLDGDYERITGSGHAGLLAPRTAGTGVGRLAFVRGPDDARVELIQRDLPLRAGPVARAGAPTVDHVALRTGDPAGAAAFYGELMGMTGAAASHGILRLRRDGDALELVPAGDTHRGGAAEGVFDHLAFRGASAGGEAPEDLPRDALRDPDGVAIEWAGA